MRRKRAVDLPLQVFQNSRKAGRVCLMNDMELDIGAGDDDSYYELDEADA
ncbi:hypothetical protein [Sulfuricystis multivorans]|nr:hypothetical protein [Sulfuricystis multivorans]